MATSVIGGHRFHQGEDTRSLARGIQLAVDAVDGDDDALRVHPPGEGSEIDVAGGSLLAQTGKVGQHLRDNDWLMGIKQRTGIPGGACEFDLPAYHHWLNLEPAARQRDLQAWLDPLLPIHSGLSIILRLLRDNGKMSRHTAYHGVFQLMLTTAKVAQLLRLSLAKETPCVPEISANKYALNIRFVGIAGMDRGAVYEGDVEFDLMFCNL